MQSLSGYPKGVHCNSEYSLLKEAELAGMVAENQFVPRIGMQCLAQHGLCQAAWEQARTTFDVGKSGDVLVDSSRWLIDFKIGIKILSGDCKIEIKLANGSGYIAARA